MSWSNRYIGIPFEDQGRSAEGCDCWGLARLVYKFELGIELPSYAGSYVSAAERTEIARLIGTRKSGPTWQAVEDASAFDLLLFRRGREDSHLGIDVGGGRMLHIAAEEHSKIEVYRFGRWASRLQGVYRHLHIRRRGDLS